MLNFSKLFLGNSFGQIIALALYPYIARFYLPEEFSIFGYIVSLTVILSVFATGQFHTALLNPEDEDEFEDLVGLATSWVMVSSFIIFLFFIFFRPDLWIVGFYLFIYSLFEIEKMCFIRNKQFNESSLTQVVFRLLGNGGKLLPQLINLKSLGLTLSEIISLMIVVSYGIKKKIFHFKFKITTLKKYLHFPLIQSFTVAINLLILDYPILVLGKRFSQIDLGYFVMGQKLIILPAIVISSAVQNSTVHNLLKSPLPQRHFFKICFLLFFIGLFGSVIFNFIGLDVLKLALGSRWTSAGQVFTLLSLLFATKFISSIVQATFVLKMATKIPFVIKVFQLIALFFLITPDHNFYDSLKLYVLIDMLVDIFLAIWAGFIIRPPFVFRSNT